MNIQNFPTDNGYEYTDEDFVRDAQRYWKGCENELKAKDGSAIRRAWHDIDEAYRAATGIYPWEEKQRYVNGAAYDRDTHLNDQSDYEFDTSDENRTPDGWPETFYEY